MQDGIDATDGDNMEDVINVGPGTFNENLVVTAGDGALKIAGAGKTETEIDGTSGAAATIAVDGSDVELALEKLKLSNTDEHVPK